MPAKKATVTKTEALAPETTAAPEAKGVHTALMPVFRVGYGDHTLLLAAESASEAMREAIEKDPVLRALPITAEPLVTDDGFACMAETEEEDIL